jgi:hypothetical protein
MRDQDGDAPDALVFTIVVHGMPSFHDQVIDDQLYQAGEAVSLGLPEAVGGNGALTYTLEGALPAGLCELRVAGGGRWECGVDVFLGWGVAAGSGV